MSYRVRTVEAAFPDLPERLRPLVEESRRVLEEAIREYRPVMALAMFSGGKDSLTTTHVVSRLLEGGVLVAHINTGIGIPQTREFVRAVAEAQGWDFVEVHPPKKTYRDMIRDYGFPGPAGHRFAYIWLKEKALNKLVQDVKSKRTQRVLVITGVRSEESQRRMGHVSPIQREKSKVWTSPIHGWSGLQVRDFLAYVGQSLNPVSDILGYSGECLCGAFAKPGEREMVRTFFPDVEKEIEGLEALARENGKPCVWGLRPPGKPRVKVAKKVKKAKKTKEKGKRKRIVPKETSREAPTFMPMCVGCEGAPE